MTMTMAEPDMHEITLADKLTVDTNPTEKPLTAEKLEEFHDRVIWQGVQGESIMEQKSKTMEIVATLTGFLLAFMLDNLLGFSSKSMKKSTHLHIYTACLCALG